jgi:hypothetical protein
MSMKPPCRGALYHTILLCWVLLSGLIAPADGVSAERPAAADSTGPTRIVFEGNEGLDEAALRKAADTELAGFEQHGGREADIDDAAYQIEAACRCGLPHRKGP